MVTNADQHWITFSIKTREPSDRPWLREDDFRYWKQRRNDLQRRGILISSDVGETRSNRVAVDIWISDTACREFEDDVCARVIDSVIRHEESLNGVRFHRFAGYRWFRSPVNT